jgi:hypothetical protein
MVLPKFLTGSYRRYKTDTIRFTTWLVETSASLGIKVPTASFVESDNNKQISSKAAKNEKKKATTEPERIQKITLSSYGTLVDAVTKAGVTLPNHIRTVLERAISLRKHCSQVIATCRRTRYSVTGVYDTEYYIRVACPPKRYKQYNHLDYLILPLFPLLFSAFSPTLPHLKAWCPI